MRRPITAWDVEIDVEYEYLGDGKCRALSACVGGLNISDLLDGVLHLAGAPGATGWIWKYLSEKVEVSIAIEEEAIEAFLEDWGNS